MAAASLGPVSAFTAPLSVRSSHRQFRNVQQQSLRMTAAESTPADDAQAEVRVSFHVLMGS